MGINKIIGIDGKTARHLSNETREGIMKELSYTEKIEMNLSARLLQSKTTVIEHLQVLFSAGLVEQVKTPGKEFAFNHLISKCKTLL